MNGQSFRRQRRFVPRPNPDKTPRNYPFNPRLRRLGIELLEDRRPEILHCHMFHANVLGRRVGRRAGVPHIVGTVHIAERRRRPWRFWLERKTDPLGTVTVCVSRAVLEFHCRRTGVPRERCTVVHNGIDTGRYGTASRPREAVRAELRLAADAEVIGAVGRLDRQKGYRYLIRAFAELARERPKAELVIAGDGPERAGLEALARRCGCAGRTRFLGRRTDVPELLHAFDVFALPSLYEGLPLALLEAMAAGVPIVASAVDSVPEVLAAGRLVRPRDVPGLADALRDALEDPAPGQVAAAQARAREQFDVGVMVANYGKLYDSLAGQSRASHPPST